MVIDSNNEMKSFGKNKFMKMLKRKKRLRTKLSRINKKISKENSNIILDINTNAPFQVTEKSIQDRIHVFARVREKCFENLHSAVITNCKKSFHESNKENTEKVCLQMEQKAILASLKISMYEDVMSHILSQVKSLTKQGLLCIAPIIKEENEKCKEPTIKISNAVPQFQRSNESPIPTAKVIPRTIDTTTKDTLEKLLESCPDVRERPVSLVKPQAQTEEVKDLNTFDDQFSLEVKECSFNMDTSEIDQGELNDMDTDVPTKNNLVESNDIDELLNILEGNDDQNGTKLDNIQNLFEYEEKPELEYSKAPAEKCTKSSKAHDSLVDSYKNERYIFLYKIFKRCADMQSHQFFRVRKSFGNYFGEDSDFEHEDLFNDNETFLSSCARRILPSVVKSIMPYYDDRRILGGSYIFKNLVRRIADSLVDHNYYPSDAEIDGYVKKYFPVGKTYHNVTDVWCFMVDYND